MEFAAVFDQYTWALFTSVGNTFPLAYRPSRSEERWITLMFIICGAGVYASIVGAISSFAMGVDASGRLYKQKLDEVREYMRWKDLGPTTRRKMLKYYELKYRGKFFEENTLLNEMNDSLRMEIAAHNCRELISKVSFLRREQNDGRDELFIGRIAIALVACFFVPGDIIITQGEMGNEMYFIMSGTVNVIAGGKRVTSFKEGAFFGEIALIANIPRTATVQAASSCMLYRLTRNAFTSILEEFDDVRKKVDVIYRDRMEKIRQEEENRKLATARELVSKVEFLQREEDDGRDILFLSNIASSLVAMFLAAGEVVFSQGEMGNEMFFVKSGTVDVIVSGKKVSSLSDGAFFGGCINAF
ncbi:UNVERIFIED_CONTAM: anaphase-promoting complex subunit Hcn1 [Siphonaria sp. JEL0065]|nr:anaphase-promoting complex subunit Hcn1 [Siphonaria sp. JEL0065]